ncbi:MAG: hypothetical protein M1814_004225 [Vezdaea aestivalis]|nr:MAG: hypothetical protein M1814_004225 [Vezdaea aestivalis]
MSLTTTLPILNEKPLLDLGAESRIAVLEDQIKELAEWKETFVKTLALAFATNNVLQKLEPPQKKKQPKAPKKSKVVVVEKELPPSPASTAVSETAHLGDLEYNKEITQLVTPPPEPVDLVVEKESTRLSIQILDVIQRYGQHLKTENGPANAWIGRSRFLPGVEAHVEANQPIKMILPSFPWKSINRVDKVTGALPDLGEELALSRLNALCKDIGQVYAHGAEITIATDGLVFNDIVGISDEDTYEYSRVLMQLAADKGFEGIKMVRVMDLLGFTAGQTMTKELYLQHVDECRKELNSQFGNADEAIREMIQSDPDTLTTYRGFIRFLETDLKHSPVAQNAVSGRQYRVIVKQVAQGMMNRAESFTKIIKARCPGFVRLSIHPSTGLEKLSVPLIVQANGSFPKSPWHCSVAVGVDGSYSTVHSKDVRETHNLVERAGRPYFYREKSDMYDWAPESVEIEHLYPSGVLVQPRAGYSDISLSEEGMSQLKKLSQVQSAGVSVQGFVNVADGAVGSESALQC